MTFYDLPQPEDLTKKEKDDAMGAYLMMFASWAAGLPLPIINLIAAVIYYFVNASKSRFVKFHSLQSLISQLPVSLLNIVGFSWTMRNVFVTDFDGFNTNYFGYMIMVFIANLLYLIFSIVGAIRASKGRMYYFMFFGGIAYKAAYKMKPGEEPNTSVNNPPAL